MNYLGIDCGATHMRVGLVDENGDLKSHWMVDSPLNSNPQSLAEIVKTLVKDEHIDGIGIGLPGLVDEKGLLVEAPNLKTVPLNISGQFDSVFNTKIHLGNDVELALLGEVWKGERVGMLTAGTGVGSAISINGKIYHENGRNIGIGHLIIDPDAKVMCGAGHNGCLEALINHSKDLGELSRWFGIGLAKMVELFKPEKILVWGGKMAMGDFLPKALEIMGQNSIQSAASEVRVEYATLKEWSGVYGSAKLAMDNKI
jgi:predicted NBD/HSP70 family sugar kinase